MTSFTTQSRRTSRAVAIVGGIALIGLLVGAAIPSALDHRALSDTHARGAGVTSLDVTGAQRLVVDSGVSDFSVDFGDVAEASLEVDGSRTRNWHLAMDRDTILVTGSTHSQPWCFGWCTRDTPRVHLTLPSELGEGTLDARLSVEAGQLSARGDFANLTLAVAAGQLNYTGAADEITATVEVGRVVADLRAAPTTTDITVSAGAGVFTLPDEPYAVTSTVSLGSLDNRLHTDPTSTRRVSAEVEVGSLILKN